MSRFADALLGAALFLRRVPCWIGRHAWEQVGAPTRGSFGEWTLARRDFYCPRCGKSRPFGGSLP